MEPVGVSRNLALMPAGHAKGRAGPLRSATSIRKYLEVRHAEIDARADGEKSHKCGKTHIFAAWVLAGLEGCKRYRQYIEGGLKICASTYQA